MRADDAVADADPGLAPDLARRGEALHARGETAEAFRLLSEGARRRPGDVMIRLVSARICLESGRIREAREWLEAALRIDPECPAALFRLGEMLTGAEGAPHRARLAAQEPWDEDFLASAAGGTPAAPPPERREALTELPRAFSFPVREEEEPEMEADAPPRVATVTLAEIYFQQGLKEQAAQIYRRLLERQPDDASVRMRLEEIEASGAEPSPPPAG